MRSGFSEADCDPRAVQNNNILYVRGTIAMRIMLHEKLYVGDNPPLKALGASGDLYLWFYEDLKRIVTALLDTSPTNAACACSTYAQVGRHELTLKDCIKGGETAGKKRTDLATLRNEKGSEALTADEKHFLDAGAPCVCNPDTHDSLTCMCCGCVCMWKSLQGGAGDLTPLSSSCSTVPEAEGRCGLHRPRLRLGGHVRRTVALPILVRRGLFTTGSTTTAGLALVLLGAGAPDVSGLEWRLQGSAHDTTLDGYRGLTGLP